jgi:hypothetical protein
MMREHPLVKNLLAAVTACALAGCSGTVADVSEEASVATQQSELIAACDPVMMQEAVEHSCVHSDFGPFEPVTAAALDQPVFVDVSVPHTAYVVTLPGAPHFGWAGRVAYIPEESGEYAFLLSRWRGLRIFDAATGTEVARECRYDVPEAVCGSLKSATVADLVAGVEYHLEFRSLFGSNSEFTLLIEEAAHPHTAVPLP